MTPPKTVLSAMMSILDAVLMQMQLAVEMDGRLRACYAQIRLAVDEFREEMKEHAGYAGRV